MIRALLSSALTAETNEFILAGRYPDAVPKTTTLAGARACQHRAQEVLEWLIQQL